MRVLFQNGKNKMDARQHAAMTIQLSQDLTAADQSNPITVDMLIAQVEKANPLLAMQIREVLGSL